MRSERESCTSDKRKYKLIGSDKYFPKFNKNKTNKLTQTTEGGGGRGLC